MSLPIPANWAAALLSQGLGACLARLWSTVYRGILNGYLPNGTFPERMHVPSLLCQIWALP